MKLKDMTVVEFINATNSKAPVPGGGSIAALNAALSAALISMVAGLTLDSPKYAAVHEKMQAIKTEADALQANFIRYIDEDSEAFDQVMAAFKMPKGTEEEQKARSEAIQSAYKTAASVPFAVATSANKLLALANEVVLHGNQSALSDCAVATLNARSAIMGAFYNVKINLTSIKDQLFVQELTTKMQEIESALSTTEGTVLANTKL
ncbi:MAG: cyclodeaminase/cyclohydrolase family protein [Acidaminococcaceae bacterium]